jgi:hypothetical protein
MRQYFLPFFTIKYNQPPSLYLPSSLMASMPLIVNMVLAVHLADASFTILETSIEWLVDKRRVVFDGT